MTAALASFLAQPLPVAGYWLWLAFPICMSIALVYKTIKAPRFADILLSSLILFITLIGGMVLFTIGLALVPILLKYTS